MAETSTTSPIPMKIGLRVDILDDEGIWNTGSIVDVSQSDDEDMVEVKYDGWGDDYNEWIAISAARLAPLHMFTMVKKCWAKLNKWPWWPAFVVLRAPSRQSAAEALEEETKLYVEFNDSFDEEKRSRCWMQKRNIESFQDCFDERASKSIGKNFPYFVEGTQRALAGGSPVLFAGHGTLPIEYSSKYTAPLTQRKLELSDGDDAKWVHAFDVFSERYRVLYGYDFAEDALQALRAARQEKGGKGEADGAEFDEDVEVLDGGDSDSSHKAKHTGRPRGRPRKGGKRPPVDDDEGEDEEKQEPEEDEASDAQEDEESDADERATRTRRSSRIIKKRKQDWSESTPTRRSTRTRRAVIKGSL